MTMSLTTTKLSATPRVPSGAGFVQRYRLVLAALRDAHETRRRHVGLGEDILCDTRLAPEDILGLKTLQPELPFFMQPGFGRHRPGC